ncbi:MAG: S8 family serine peptidase [Candidatus Wenzhouxiangella sp. M2_3B_020]
MSNQTIPRAGRHLLLLSTSILIAASALAAPERTAIERPMPAALEQLRLDQPVTTADFDFPGIDPSLIGESGRLQVVIRLSDPSVAQQELRGRKAQRAREALIAEQSDLLADLLAADPSARVIARTQLVLNAVFVDADAGAIRQLRDDPRVGRVARIADYEFDLSETVPYIGASSVQAAGADGAGVRVAVLDSGIDYYHAALGGSGIPADYAADDPTVVEAGSFPTAKVVAGYDFVGEAWPSFGPLAPDADPLDSGPAAGHGTHVAHIIGGEGGVAPGVDLFAVKVCSSVGSSCSGVALIQGMEFAVDPDGDGDPGDAVDVINMSLGSTYGQPFDDDLSLAVDNATALGVLTVASAGNSSNKPYVTGTPSAAKTAISVAQTHVPSAALPLIDVDGTEYRAVFQSWSPAPASVLTGPVQYADGAGGNLNGCAPFAPGSLSGLIVLVDRGACLFTLKIKNIGDAGGIAGIIGLIAPGEPFSGGFGDPGGAITVPGYMISQDDSNAIKSQINSGPGIGTIDPANQLALVRSVVGSSSRGPRNPDSFLKPELGAPGASISANAGTGTGEGPFGGTSGAAPMVAGSAALVLDVYPDLSPVEVKARLMNNGETDIDTDPGSGLAPVSRIGGGEVRADRAVAAPAAAWDDDEPTGALSFGYVDAEDSRTVIHRTVRVRNYSSDTIEYTVHPSFRFDDDEASGALSVQVPNKVKVQPGRDATFTVKVTIDAARLPANHMNSGSEGANAGALTLNEFDGYLLLDDGSHPIHLAWHMLPRKSALVKARTQLDFEDGSDTITLNNIGLGAAQTDAYALLATSPNMPEGARGAQQPTPDLRAVGVNTFLVPPGVCSGDPSFVWAFAMNTWEPQSHLVPVSHQVVLDIDQDGAPDFSVLNRDFTFNQLADGRQLSWALNLGTGGASARFFAEHATNTGNTVLYVCAEQVGLSAADLLDTNVNAFVVTQDFYFGGPGDLVGGLTITPLGERYLGLPPAAVPPHSTGEMNVLDFGPFSGNSPELGVMLITNGDRGPGARGGATLDSEAILINQ